MRTATLKGLSLSELSMKGAVVVQQEVVWPEYHRQGVGMTYQAQDLLPDYPAVVRRSTRRKAVVG